MKLAALTLATLTLTPSAWAQKPSKDTGWHLTLPALRQLTVQGLYGENTLVRAAGSPLLGVTYSHFDATEIHVGEDDELKRRGRLHLPNGGWYLDMLTGSRAGTQVQSFGFGGAVRLTSTPLKGERGTPNDWYYGFGAGLYATRVEAVRHTTRVGAGFRLFGGKDFRDGTVAELAYTYRPGTQGVHPSGLSLGLGRRF